VSENLDLVRSIFAAWERGDFTSAEWAHPEMEFVFVGGPSQGRCTGLAGMAGAMRDFLTSWEEFSGVNDEYRELDDERVRCSTRRGQRARQPRAACPQRASIGISRQRRKLVCAGSHSLLRCSAVRSLSMK
jgi:hypothetical protein